MIRWRWSAKVARPCQAGLGPEVVAERLGGDHQRVHRGQCPFLPPERPGVALGGPHHGGGPDRAAVGGHRPRADVGGRRSVRRCAPPVVRPPRPGRGPAGPDRGRRSGGCRWRPSTSVAPTMADASAAESRRRSSSSTPPARAAATSSRARCSCTSVRASTTVPRGRSRTRCARRRPPVRPRRPWPPWPGAWLLRPRRRPAGRGGRPSRRRGRSTSPRCGPTHRSRPRPAR